MEAARVNQARWQIGKHRPGTIGQLPDGPGSAMTTISSNTSAFSSLVSLYAKSDDGTGSSSASLTQAQQQNIVSMLEGGDSSTSSGLSTLLGTSDTTTSSTDLNSILDAIQAQTDATAGAATTDNSTSTATTEQKAATLMQSVYQSQQSNLFTLLG
jgi:hypothetical protein